jgi:hypothetical protein
MSIEYSNRAYSTDSIENRQIGANNPSDEKYFSTNQSSDDSGVKKRKYLDVDPQTDDFLNELDELDDQADYNNVFPSDSDQNINTINDTNAHMIDSNDFQTEASCLDNLENFQDEAKFDSPGSKAMFKKKSKSKLDTSCPVNYQSLQLSYSKLKRSYDLFDTMIKNQIGKMHDFQNQVRNERDEINRQLKALNSHLKVCLYF